MVAATDIEVRHLPGQTIAYQRFRGTIPSIEVATSAVRSWVVTMGYEPKGPLAIELQDDPTDDAAREFDVEVHLPVEDSARAHPDDQVQIKRFEPTDAVVLTLHGPYDITRMREPLERMRAWLRERSGRSATVARWVEVTDPTKVAPDEQVTELQLLVEPGTLAERPPSPPVAEAAPPPAPAVSAAVAPPPIAAVEAARADDRTAPVPEPGRTPMAARDATAAPPETRRMVGEAEHAAASAPRSPSSPWPGEHAQYQPGEGGISKFVFGLAGVVAVALGVVGIVLFRRRRS